MKYIAAVAAILIAATVTSAHATEGETKLLGWTIKASYGYAAWEEDRSVAREGTGEGSVQLSKDVFGMNASRQVFETDSLRLDLGVGGFYHPKDKNCTKIRAEDAELLPFSKVCTTTEAYSLGVNGNATVPVTNKFAFKFGAGIGHYQLDVDLNIPGVVRAGGEDQGVSTNFLIGVAYAPTNNVELGVDLRHHKMYEDDIEVEPLTTVGISASLLF